jgi:membrane protein
MAWKSIWGLIRETFNGFSRDQVTTLAAALAYYAIFSIAPLLVIIVGVAGLVFGEQGTRQELTQQIQQAVGQRSAAVVQSMMTSQTRTGSLLATILGGVVLLLGASGVFSQLKTSLNVIFHVRPRPGRGVFGLVIDRLVSLLVVLAIGLLLLCSMLLSTVISAFSQSLNNLISLPGFVVRLLQLGVTLCLVVLLFALIFKMLPDVRIRWRNVWMGALMTAVLFLAGEYLLGWYLGRQAATSPYGAAGAVVLLLMWIYYSAIILLVGAEFTLAYAKHKGSTIEPTKYAEWATGPDTMSQAA